MGRTDPADKSNKDELGNTTLLVYRYIYKQSEPLGLHDIQRGVGLSSASVALYHVRKLLDAGLIRAQDQGYVADKIMFENMIRIRHSLVPLQSAFATFFATALLLMITIFRRSLVDVSYIFAVIVILTGLGFFILEVIREIKLFK